MSADAVREAEARRQRLAADRDVDAHAKLLDPALVYVHSTGLRQDRDGYLDFLRAGVVDFADVHHELTDVRTAGGDAIALGRMRGSIVTPEGPRSIDTWTTSHWRHDGTVWRLAAFQGTSLN